MKDLINKLKEAQQQLADAALAGDMAKVAEIAKTVEDANTNLQLAKEMRKVTNAEKPRLPYVGVYHNNGDNSDEKPYRAALCTNKGKPNEKWLNLGYFADAANAAKAFNLYSITMFKGKGMVNRIASNDAQEWAEYAAKKADRVADASKIIDTVTAGNGSLRFFEPVQEAA